VYPPFSRGIDLDPRRHSTRGGRPVILGAERLASVLLTEAAFSLNLFIQLYGAAETKLMLNSPLAKLQNSAHEITPRPAVSSARASTFKAALFLRPR
jgi:hypothetical protein